MIVTATTITDRHQIPQARERVRQLSASARVRLRPAIHAQDVVFQAGLPLGLVLPKHLSVPTEIRESI